MSKKIYLLTSNRLEYENIRLNEALNNKKNKLVEFIDLRDIIDNNPPLYTNDDSTLLLLRTTPYENIELLEKNIFDNNNIKIINTVEATKKANNKLTTFNILSANNIPVAPTTTDMNVAIREFGFPMVVKPVIGSKGEGVRLLLSSNDNITSDNIFIKQQYIKESHGRDLRVLVVGGKVLGAMLRHNPNDFRANISTNGYGEGFPVSDEIEDLALRTAKILGLEIAGIDLLFTNKKNSFLVCEANASPGFKGFETYTGVRDVAERIADYLLYKLHRR